MKRAAAGAGLLNPVPRCRRRNGTAKIQPVNGSRVEIFLRPLRKNTTRPLIGWIGGTDKAIILFRSVGYAILYLYFK